MPAGNGTGPMGFGPMTRRGAGYYAGFPGLGYMSPALGRGFWPRSSYWSFAAGHGLAPYRRGLGPYGYGVRYVPVWGRRFGGRRGRRFGRGRGRCFGRGRVWGRGWGSW
ncbi:MAG: DUF5320 domain-containing protein [Phycisphaerae bacterium]|nr:DUF5320 domain-containing protein [Phycisphaerae bacterium]